MENVESESLALETELNFYRQNQVVTEQEIKTLISDNQKLSQQVGILLKEKVHQAQQVHDNDQRKEIEESKNQIYLLTKERDSLHVLWQTSQKTIEALETELKTYQSYNSRTNQNTTEENRELELKLETALSDYIELEAKYKKLLIERTALEKDLRDQNKKINGYKERGKNLEDDTEKLNKLLEEYKINLAAEQKSHEDLKLQLVSCQRECVSKVKREAEAKSKVAEALQLFDLVTSQKNEALKKIAVVTEELARVKSMVATVKRDAEDNFRSELDLVKQNYNEKVSDMLHHIRNLDNELVEKGVLLNKVLRENKILQTTNETHIQQEQENEKLVDPKLAVVEQRLEVVFQELIVSERRNIQLVCEKQTLAMDLQRTQDIYTRESKRRDWEENLLKTQIQELRLQVEHLQKSLDETHSMINKLQTMLASGRELNQRMVSTKENEMLELNKHLENQMELNKKWKESYMHMTEKIKSKLEALYKENEELRSQLNMSRKGSSKENSTASVL